MPRSVGNVANIALKTGVKREHEARLPLPMSVGQRLGAEIRCIADGETLASCSLLTLLPSHCDDWAFSN